MEYPGRQPRPGRVIPGFSANLWILRAWHFSKENESIRPSDVDRTHGFRFYEKSPCGQEHKLYVGGMPEKWCRQDLVAGASKDQEGTSSGIIISQHIFISICMLAFGGCSVLGRYVKFDGVSGECGCWIVCFWGTFLIILRQQESRPLEGEDATGFICARYPEGFLPPLQGTRKCWWIHLSGYGYRLACSEC